MCQFKSAIAVKDEREKCGFRLLWSPFTESHEDLVSLFKLKDVRDNLARVEFYPKSGLSEADKVENYELRIDEKRTPDWLDEAAQAIVTQKMRAYIESIIIRGDADLLMGGQFILAGAKVQCISTAAVVVTMLGTSQVGSMLGTSQVGTMWDTSKVGEMLDTSKIGVMRETSKVGEMLDTSKVGDMRDTSQIGVMRDTSQIGVMRDTSQIGTMWDTSQVGMMLGTSKVEKDNRKKE